MAEILVDSSHGTFRIDGETGLPVDTLPKTLGSISRFNTEELREHYIKIHGFSDIPPNIDILEIGYWLEDGMYEPPVPEYREPECLTPEDYND